MSIRRFINSIQCRTRELTYLTPPRFFFESQNFSSDGDTNDGDITSFSGDQTTYDGDLIVGDIISTYYNKNSLELREQWSPEELHESVPPVPVIPSRFLDQPPMTSVGVGSSTGRSPSSQARPISDTPSSASRYPERRYGMIDHEAYDLGLPQEHCTPPPVPRRLNDIEERLDYPQQPTNPFYVPDNSINMSSMSTPVFRDPVGPIVHHVTLSPNGKKLIKSKRHIKWSGVVGIFFYLSLLALTTYTNVDAVPRLQAKCHLKCHPWLTMLLSTLLVLVVPFDLVQYDRSSDNTWKQAPPFTVLLSCAYFIAQWSWMSHFACLFSVPPFVVLFVILHFPLCLALIIGMRKLLGSLLCDVVPRVLFDDE